MLRQVPTALRAWCAKHVLGEHAAEALMSPLTFSHGVFRHSRPTMHEANAGATPTGAAGTWDWTVEAVANPTWSTTAWEHDVLVTVEETEVGALEALFYKAALTSRRGKRVLMLLATQRKLKHVNKRGAQVPLQILRRGLRQSGHN